MKKVISTLMAMLPISLIAEEQGMQLDLIQIFKSCPLIYAILFFLSLFSFVVWSYSLLSFRVKVLMPTSFLQQIAHCLRDKQYDKALGMCKNSKHALADILASGIQSRQHGHPVMIEAMQAEGKRCGITLWQRLSLLNDVAVIAPMLGLLGTVLGLFYAFYDVNRTPDTLSSIFDGLGIAVGTTVAGLIVAILAMIFYATLKFRVVRILTRLENEALTIGSYIETP